MEISEIASVIVVVAGVCAAVTTIYKFIKAPIQAADKQIKEKKQEEVDELTQSITESVMEQVEPLLTEIRDINLNQNRKIEWLTNGQLDLLRQQILYLYEHHYKEQELTENEMEQLHKLYNDYTAGGGNSFVGQIYTQMCTWKIIPNK